ncbi:MAG: hypothetical protein INR73_24925 [Williamsia sp.]|nr:hypothetical protein [Williamsia sp.]
MKTIMFKGICTAAVCIALSTFTANKTQAATTNPGDTKVSASYFQDSTSRRGNKGNSGRMNNGSRMNGGKMSGDSTGRMGNMKGKSSGGYKGKGNSKSKMDTTQRQ